MKYEDKVLNRELLRRIFGNLGAVPGKNFGRVGVVLNEFILQNCAITLENESGIKEDYKIWAGECKVASTYRVLLTNIGTINEPEFILIFEPEGDEIIGMHLVYEDEEDFGTFMVRRKDEWTPISMLRKLNLAAGIELLTQEGIGWYSCHEVGKLY